MDRLSEGVTAVERITFRNLVSEAFNEVMNEEYPGREHDEICRIDGLPEMDNQASSEWGAEVVNDSSDAIRCRRRIFIPKSLGLAEAKQILKQGIYAHCVLARDRTET